MIDLETSATADESAPPDHIAELSPRMPRLELQPEPQPSESRRYEADELLRYHDRHFVSNSYLAIHKRPPTEAELIQAVDDLRSGRRTKIEMIGSMLEAPTGSEPRVEISGLTSPAGLRVNQWPVIGFLTRMFSSFARLPRLIRDQQRFEAYSLGQQQKIVDYLNDVLVPAIHWYNENSPAIANLSTTIADACETVTMLSDSLIELSVQQAELQSAFQAQLEQLQTAQAHQAQIEIKLQERIEKTQGQTEQIRAQMEQTRPQVKQAQAQIQQLQNDQAQQSGAYKQLQKDLISVSSSQTAQQKAIEELQHALEETRSAHNEAADAQQEFLIQEQRVIVETQKVVLGDLQTQIDNLVAQQKQKTAELAGEVRKLKTLVASATDRYGVSGPNQPPA